MVSAIQTGLRVVSFGECMLELQGTAFGNLQQSYGGDTLNTAVYMARLGSRRGLRVDYATALGDDPLSAGMLQRWQAEGIGTGLVRQLPGRLPGLYLIDVDSNGERRFSYWRDQAAARAYFDVPEGSTPLELQVGAIDALYFSGISLAILPAAGRSRLLKVAAQVRAQGGMVAFDNNYRPRLWASVEEARAAFTAATDAATLALMTLDDEQALWSPTDAGTTAGTDAATNAGTNAGTSADTNAASTAASTAEAQLQRTLALPCPEVVVKRGALPTVVRCAGQPAVQVATEPVLRVVDSTAAGDSFAGAYIAFRLGGGTAVESAASGNRMAARVVQHRGAVIALNSMADLMAR